MQNLLQQGLGTRATCCRVKGNLRTEVHFCAPKYTSDKQAASGHAATRTNEIEGYTTDIQQLSHVLALIIGGDCWCVQVPFKRHLMLTAAEAPAGTLSALAPWLRSGQPLPPLGPFLGSAALALGAAPALAVYLAERSSHHAFTVKHRMAPGTALLLLQISDKHI